MAASLLLCSVGNASATSEARDGLPDPAFGANGSVTLSASPNPAQPFGAPYIQDVAADARGRIYLLTWASSPEETRPAVVRLDRSGLLDPSYGIAGRSTVPTVGFFDSINLFPALEVDGEGNAVVAAIRRRADLSYCTALHRLRADGSHDDAFQPFPPDRCTDFGSPLLVAQSAWAIALDRHEGRLLLTGPAELAGTAGTGIARLEADGSPVAGFGNGGLVRPGAAGPGVSPSMGGARLDSPAFVCERWIQREFWSRGLGRTAVPILDFKGVRPSRRFWSATRPIEFWLWAVASADSAGCSLARRA